VTVAALGTVLLPVFNQYQLVSDALAEAEVERLTGPISPLGLNPVADVPVTL
jgi:hypothetical protein